MNGDFYRGIPKRRQLKNVIRTMFKNKARTISIVVALLSVMYLLFDNKGIVRRIQLEVREGELTEEITRAKEETKLLLARLKAVEVDQQMIETLARERYGMAREGETVYRVKKD